MKISNPVYFKIAIPIVVVLVLLALSIVFKNSDEELINNLDDNVEVIVRDANESDSLTSDSNSDDTENISQELSPATVEDLGGTNGTGNLDQLLEDKEIEVGE